MLLIYKNIKEIFLIHKIQFKTINTLRRIYYKSIAHVHNGNKQAGKNFPRALQ